MEHKINTINNFYGTNQFYLKEETGGFQTLYNIKNMETIVLLKNEITVKLDNNRSIRETFETEEEAKEMFMYISLGISEGARLIGRPLFLHNKALMDESY